jgi:hypothetical protein
MNFNNTIINPTIGVFNKNSKNSKNNKFIRSIKCNFNNKDNDQRMKERWNFNL